MGDNRQVKAIKECIVRACRRGECRPDGGHIPIEKRGAGKGSHYIGRDPDSLRRFRENYAEIDWSH
jgi:hypothetical protein